MKTLFVFLLCLVQLSAQDVMGRIDFGSGTLFDDLGMTMLQGKFPVSNTVYHWAIIRNSDGSKTFKYVAYNCNYAFIVPAFNLGRFELKFPGPKCTTIYQSDASTLAPIAAALKEFYGIAPSVPHNTVYGPFAAGRGNTRAAITQPVTEPDPQMIFLDGLGNTLNAYDLTTNTVVKQVVVPSTSGPLGIRPALTGNPSEVWVANGGVQVSVADLDTQTLVTNIKTPTIPSAGAPAGIVFTPSGNTALEAIKFFSPDASGNLGALLVFDAVGRSLKSTFPLNFYPSAILMAPDGLTVYLLDDNGKLVYYDILSGTADLVTRTDTPGVASGFSSLGGKIFLHPDGNRLIWNANSQVQVFDLTTRKVVHIYNAGLPTTASVSMEISQDGSLAYMTGAAGDVVVLDLRYGNIMASYKTDPASALYPGPALP